LDEALLLDGGLGVNLVCGGVGAFVVGVGGGFHSFFDR
jgi:hypothetical protein